LGQVPSGLAALMERCLRADGGRPSPADLSLLESRWASSSVVAAFIQRASDGTLVAAGFLRRAGDELRFLGMVDPSTRGRGIGSALLDLGLAEAQHAAAASREVGPAQASGAAGPKVKASPGGAGPTVVVETESLSEAAEELFASRGLRQSMAEDIMGCDPAVAQRPEPADGMELVEWDNETAERFHALYRTAFRDQPHFADESAQEWIEDYAGKPHFRPQWSLLLSLQGIGDAGFVTASVGWIGEIGVVPEARRRGVAGILLRETLARMAAAGTPHVALGVDIDNAGAAALYQRIGFISEGRWARYHLS
jgi:ribosomal protein S18 acetylase RimI-like enzyme